MKGYGGIKSNKFVDSLRVFLPSSEPFPDAEAAARTGPGRVPPTGRESV